MLCAMGPTARFPSRRKQPLKRDPVAPALAAFAHEVRTPLNGIVALAELLAASDLPARERGWADALKGAAEHLAQLTTIVVDGAKADATGLVLREQPFSPRQLADDLALSLQARATTKGLQATVTIADVLPESVSGDAIRLRAALENLIDNAVKFTGRGSIAFAAGAETNEAGTRLTYVITDDGIGLSQDEIGRLFSPFTQASAETGREFGGAGLGLAFARSVARAMGGDLTVASAPGKGSTFRLQAVVAPATSDSSTSADPRGRSDTSAPPLRILCAEDNPYGRVVMNTIAHALGHSVDFVGDGAAAVSAVGANKHDIVLMDLTLPGLDGIEATRRIRALPGRSGTIPVIGVSGHTEDSDAIAARTAGMDEYLAKPVSPTALAQAIARVTPRVRGA